MFLSSGAFVVLMNYAAFTSDSLTMMYEAVRGASASNDATEKQGAEPRFKVRDTLDWRRHAADLEAEIQSAAWSSEMIDWNDGQEAFPFVE